MTFYKCDTIKCADKEDALKVIDALRKDNIDWDFLYEKDGVKGIWIEIVKE